jgi:Zn finger protein HypA/HybF involved in hydrogenase expression
MVNLDECKNPDGSMDYKKYDELRKADLSERKAKGEVCKMPDCNRFVMWAKGYPQICPECKSLDNPDELNHPSNVRCPKCGHNWSVWDGDSYSLYEEGEHQVDCGQCGHEFEVVTSISYDFQSPERLKPGEEKNEQD